MYLELEGYDWLASWGKAGLRCLIDGGGSATILGATTNVHSNNRRPLTTNDVQQSIAIPQNCDMHS